MADTTASALVQLMPAGISEESPQINVDTGASPVTSPVGSSLLRAKRARAFATARVEVCAAALDPNQQKTEDFSPLKKFVLGTLGMSGLSQSELDSLCVFKSAMSESVSNSHADVAQEGLDQATLDAMSVQNLAEVNTERDGLIMDEQLLRIRRCRAFEGPKAASMMAENEAAHFRYSNSLGGISQSTLDLMCNSEELSSPETTELSDSALCRMRRMRAYLGPDKAESIAAAEQHQLCLSIPGGLSQATLNELCSQGDDNGGSESNSECPDNLSPEPTSSMLLRIRRTRAFLGQQQDCAPEEEPQSVLVASPAKAHKVCSSEDVNISTAMEPTSTTCSTRSSFSEGNEVDVVAAVHKMHMPTRKARLVRGGA